jgi:hypothetical protein
MKLADCGDEHRGKIEDRDLDSPDYIPLINRCDLRILLGKRGSLMSDESERRELKGRCNEGGSNLDDLHNRIQSKLDELHADFGELGVDVRAANQSSERAWKVRIEGFKRALRDLLQAANRADGEWQRQN